MKKGELSALLYTRIVYFSMSIGTSYFKTQPSFPGTPLISKPGISV